MPDPTEIKHNTVNEETRMTISIRHALKGTLLTVALAAAGIAQAGTLTLNVAFKGPSQRAV